MAKTIATFCTLVTFLVSMPLKAQSPEFVKWAAGPADIQKNSKTTNISNDVNKLLKRGEADGLTPDDFLRLAQLQQNLYLEESRDHKQIAEYIRNYPPRAHKELVAFAVRFFEVHALAYADMAEDFERAQRRMKDLPRSAYDLINQQESQNALARLRLLMEQQRNYQWEFQQHRKDIDDRLARSENSTLFEKFIDGVAKNVEIEVAVESKEIPVSIAIGPDGPSVSVLGQKLVPLETPTRVFGGQFRHRKVYVESQKGSQFEYDLKLDDKPVKLSFPVAKYSLDYRGYDIVLRLQTK